MFRNYVSAALNNLARNWLYAGITITGLAVSFAAAILIGLYLRDEYTFENFVPGYQNVYRFAETLILPGEKPYVIGVVPGSAAPQLKLDFPQVERVARLEPFNTDLKRGAHSFQDLVYWADPGFFRIVQYPVLAGDPDAALEAPDGLVLTRAAARKYFGQDTPIGSTLLVRTGWLRPDMSPDEANMMSAYHPMRVMAVLQDLPSNTNIDVQVFASGRAPFSATAADERHLDQFSANALSFVKLKPGASPDQISAHLKTYADAHFPLYGGGPSNYRFRLTPLRDLHFESTAQPTPGFRPPGDRRVDAGVAAIGALVVLIAAMNFVTLMTARATRRAVEVGVRKAVGARRRDLVFQFMGEALIYVVISMVIAVALAELLLPYLNGFVQRTLRFDYLGDPRVGGTIVAAALLTALLAGLYPSLVLSGFRPASALKGGASQPAGSASVRNVLVVGQFAILIGLIVMTGTIYRQTNFALHDALRLDTSQVVEVAGPCRGAFRQELERLPGVKAVSCGSPMALGVASSKTVIFKRDRSMQTVSEGPLDAGFYEIHGLKPLAGRFFSKANGEDMVLDRPAVAPPSVQPPLVINVAAAHALGYSNPADAVGKRYAWVRWDQPTPPGRIPQQQVSEIVGVAPDFSLGSVRSPIQPTLYYVNPNIAQVMLVKLDARTVPESLRAMDAIWKRTGHDQFLQHVFENQAVQGLYRDVITQGVALAICSGLAIFIACMGLFALAAFVTERRTKEIGVRKAMGATTSDVVRLLLWQFTKPVLWANLIAWPLAFWAMDHWLKGFAYRVDLPPWLFVIAAGAAVLIAWATVSTHAWLVARAKPATALRYE
jgi:putative ABC transport system permease protein